MNVDAIATRAVMRFVRFCLLGVALYLLAQLLVPAVPIDAALHDLGSAFWTGYFAMAAIGALGSAILDQYGTNHTD